MTFGIMTLNLKRFSTTMISMMTFSIAMLSKMTQRIIKHNNTTLS